MKQQHRRNPYSVATTPVDDCISAAPRKNARLIADSALPAFCASDQLPRHAVEQGLRRYAMPIRQQRAVDRAGTAVTPSSSDSG
jgi:hypothetical protein